LSVGSQTQRPLLLTASATSGGLSAHRSTSYKHSSSGSAVCKCLVCGNNSSGVLECQGCKVGYSPCQSSDFVSKFWMSDIAANCYNLGVICTNVVTISKNGRSIDIDRYFYKNLYIDRYQYIFRTHFEMHMNVYLGNRDQAASSLKLAILWWLMRRCYRGVGDIQGLSIT
jgi:hypothetical protein